MTELYELGATELRKLIRAREVTRVEVVSLPGALGKGAQLAGCRFQDREVLAAARTARAALGPVTVV